MVYFLKISLSSRRKLGPRGTSRELHASKGKSFAQPGIAAQNALALLVGADLGIALGEGERPSGEGPLPRYGGLESPAEHALDS